MRTERQAFALHNPIGSPTDPIARWRTTDTRRDGNLFTSVLAVDRWGRLNDGAPVWHASLSLWTPRHELIRSPGMLERLAVGVLAEVGGEHEWWFYNPKVGVGHLRVPVTAAELVEVPPGCVVGDAGETGLMRPRTRRPEPTGIR